MFYDFHSRVQLSGRQLGCLLALTLLLPIFASAQELEELPLPKWTDEAGDTVPPERQLGGLLWPEGYKPDGAAGESANEGPMIPKDDRGVLLFIPKPNIGTGPVLAPNTLPKDLIEVDSTYLQRCETLEEGEHVLDPEGLLHETQGEDLRRLLNYHVGQSTISAYVLLLDAHQKLPASVPLTRVAGGRLTKERSCLVVYPLGSTRRARLFMSKEITQTVTPAYLRTLVQGCMIDAMQASDPIDQLQRFAIQLSVRLIWLERAHTLPEFVRPIPSAPKVAAAEADPESAPATSEPGAELLPEIAAKDEPVQKPWLKLPPAMQAMGKKAGPIGAGALALLVLGLWIRRAQRRRNRRAVWLLPEVEYKKRLGGQHCGGGGASIRYGS
ncbi:MAG: hypothetical protein QM796_21460 [Chthoniobacteraceae bacterium]